MSSWSRHSSIAATMLNPALLAAVIASAANGHRTESDDGFPMILSFVVAPMILHRGTREALPSRTTTHLATWVSRNPVLRAGLPQRALGLVEPVRAGIRFGIANGALHLDGDRLHAERLRPRKSQTPPELDMMLRKANTAGRWLAKTSSPATVLAILGMAP
ncbi:three component ABC system middle component [Nocardia sp. NPDC004582]